MSRPYFGADLPTPKIFTKEGRIHGIGVNKIKVKPYKKLNEEFFLPKVQKPLPNTAENKPPQNNSQETPTQEKTSVFSFSSLLEQLTKSSQPIQIPSIIKTQPEKKQKEKPADDLIFQPRNTLLPITTKKTSDLMIADSQEELSKSEITTEKAEKIQPEASRHADSAETYSIATKSKKSKNEKETNKKKKSEVSKLLKQSKKASGKSRNENFVRLNLKSRYKDRHRGQINALKLQYKKNGRIKLFSQRKSKKQKKQNETSLEETPDIAQTLKEKIDEAENRSFEMLERIKKDVFKPFEECAFISRPLKRKIRREIEQKFGGVITEEHNKKLAEQNIQEEEITTVKEPHQHDKRDEIIPEKLPDDLFVLPSLSGFQEKEENIDDLDAILRKHYRFQKYREGQKEAIVRILNKKPTLVVLATGAGKSLVYQIPTLLMDGMTIVVSPLISLIADQIEKVPDSLPAVSLNSQLTEGQRKKVIELLKAGHVKLLFISPEMLPRLEASEYPPINFVCVDEAHCISEWSHNFRPSYFKLKETIKEHLKVDTILGLTATATQKTKISICEQLGIDYHNGGVIQSEKIIRDNISITVTKDREKIKALIELLKSPLYKDLKSMIVYCNYKRDADNIATHLNISGISAAAYHGDKDGTQRMNVHESFLQGKIKVVVATNAFGMGIDKQDVRAVIHLNLPKSIESYIQEAGRAGRDGKPAYCHLFLEDDDFFRMRATIYSDVIEKSQIRSIMRKMREEATSSNTKQPLPSRLKKRSRDEAFEIEDENKVYLSEDEESKNEQNRPKEEVTQLSVLKFKDVIEKHDIKKELIITLLVKLDSDEFEFFKLKHVGDTIFKIGFYKKSPEELAKDEPFFQHVIDSSRKSKGVYRCCLAKLSNKTGISLPDLIVKLKKLQRTGELNFEPEEEGFFYIWQPLESEELMEEYLNKLHNYMHMIQKDNVQKGFLKNEGGSFYSQKASQEIYKLFSDYFLDKNSFIEIVQEASKPEGSLPLLHATTPDEQMKIIDSIKRFIKEFKEAIFSIDEEDKANLSKLSKAITVLRILQSVNSKKFPVSEWRKNEMWGKYWQYGCEEITNFIKMAIVEVLDDDFQAQAQKKIKMVGSPMSQEVLDSVASPKLD